MLKIFCGYNLEHVETSHELNLHHYMHDKDVVKLCEDFLNNFQPFGNETISIKTNYDLAIETFVAYFMSTINGSIVKLFIEMKISKNI